MTKTGPKPKDRVNFTALAGKPEPPGHLDAEGRKHWDRLTDRIADAGYLSRLDEDALTLYMAHWTRWRKAEAELAKKGKNGGPVVVAPNGYRQVSPWYKVAVQCMRDMRPFLNMFGLSPAARAKLALPEPEEFDEKWMEPEAD